MLKTILIGLDGTKDCESALELGLRWAKLYDALLIGCGVVDTPGIQVAESTLFAEGYRGPSEATMLTDVQRIVEQALSQFASRCEEAGIRYRTLEDFGTPYLELLNEAQRYDLILLGRQTHFEFGWRSSSDATLQRVAQEGSRPVVAVPPTPRDDGPVLLAFDGSTQASRALAAFEATGLLPTRSVHVLSVDRDRELAARLADRAVDFLRFHEREAIPLPVATSAKPAETILAEAERLGAGLLVMGAYGHSTIHEFFLGSVTRSVLKETTLPVFCSH